MKNKVLTALFSLVVAFGLWMYVITSVSPGSEATFYNIPVVFQGEGELVNRGLMITSEKEPTVTLRIAGNRSDLNKLSSSNITVIADVSKLWEPCVASLDYIVSYPGNIQENVLSILNRNPGKINIKVDERISKPVDVVIDYKGNVPDGFVTDKANVETDVSTVIIRGPKPVVDQIESARITVDLTGQTQTIIESMPYTLCDKNGKPVDVQMVETDVEAVSVILQIQRVKDITLAVDVIEGGGATKETSSITLSTESIKVSGSESLLDKLDDTLIIGTVDLGKVDKDTVLTFQLQLPEGITNETGITEVTAEVKFPNLLTKSVKVADIHAVGVPNGMEAEFITKELEIRIRGPIAMVNAITPGDLTVTVDFSDAAAGISKLKASITFPEGLSDVGAVGTYTVSASLNPRKS